MAGRVTHRLALLALLCLLVLPGCKDAEKQQAVADANAAKAALAQVNSQLDKARANWQRPKRTRRPEEDGR